MTTPWPPSVDPIGEALHALRMSSTFTCRSELTAPWGLEMPAFDRCMSYHVVSEGGCWLTVPGTDPVPLRAGDVALVPHGRGHTLGSAPGVRCEGRVDQLPQEHLGERYTALVLGGGGDVTRLVCGVVAFDHPAAHQLVRLLPAVIRVDGTATGWLRAALGWMSQEAAGSLPGGDAVVTRLADLLVIQAIRTWLASDPAAPTGWLGALRDPQIGRVLAAVHRDPAHPWTVDGLARIAGMSRSAFAARFTASVGEPAMAYVTRWRMQVAQIWMHQDHATVGELAGRLGYRSEAAFSRAFKRSVGVSPGAVRRAGR